MSEDYCRCGRLLEVKGAVRVCSSCKEPQDNCKCPTDRWWEKAARKRGERPPDAISRRRGAERSRGARAAVVALGIVCFVASVLVTPTLLQWGMQSYYEDCQKPYCEGTYCETGESVGKPSCEGPYSLVVLAVPVLGVVGLYFALRWAFEGGGSKRRHQPHDDEWPLPPRERHREDY
jgi:hypothetical protein